MYNVVFRNISKTTSNGVITWSTYSSKEEFDSMNVGNMRKWYQVIEEGVSQDRAVQLCSGHEATSAVMISKSREIRSDLRKVLRRLNEIQ